MTNLLIPLYVYPGSNIVAWSPIVNAQQAYPEVEIVAVINPASGAGTTADPNYVRGIDYLLSAGVRVYGYTASSYATKPLTSIETDITNYRNFYNITDGLFIDQMASLYYEPSSALYYEQVNQMAKAYTGMKTIGNAGNAIPSSMIGIFDATVVYENAGMPPTQALPYPPSNFAYLAYGVPTLNPSLFEALNEDYGYCFVTSLSLAQNPYGAISPYLTAMMQLL